MKQEIRLEGKLIGWVYKSSHGVWVAERLDLRSQSFLREVDAIIALCKYGEN